MGKRYTRNIGNLHRKSKHQIGNDKDTLLTDLDQAPAVARLVQGADVIELNPDRVRDNRRFRHQFTLCRHGDRPLAQAGGSRPKGEESRSRRRAAQDRKANKAARGGGRLQTRDKTLRV